MSPFKRQRLDQYCNRTWIIYLVGRLYAVQFSAASGSERDNNTHTQTAEKNTLAITRHAESHEIIRSNNQRRELIDD